MSNISNPTGETRSIPSDEVISTIMKKILPTDYIIDDSAIKFSREALKEFIYLLVSEMTIFSSESKDKINGNDVISAIDNIGMDQLSEVIRLYISKYNQSSDSS